METEKMTKDELSLKIREKMLEFNSLLLIADELKLRVRTKQGFHPMMNSIGAPLNPSLSATITENIEY